MIVANQWVCTVRAHRCRSSAGVLSFRHRRGRSFSSAAIAEWSSSQMLRSVPFGKYWRRSPLMFSLLPRCQGECGSAK